MSAADVVIIGAGITGCGAGHHLAHDGLSVVVLERGASNRSASRSPVSSCARSTARRANLRAVIMRMTDRIDLDHLTSRGQALTATGSQRLLGTCGAPDAGTSTLAERLALAAPSG